MNDSPTRRARGAWFRRVVLPGLLTFMLPAVYGQQTNTPASGAGPAANDTVAAYKKLSLEQLMNLDVTSVSREPIPYGEAPAAIDVITGDEIHRSGAWSIPQALRLADNLDVAQSSSSGWNISARGFNASPGNKLLALMDGRTIYTPLFSGVIWNMQDYLMEDIERIEVISGPGGTLWGANAVNGVINITTKSAQDTQGVYLDAGGGTQLTDFTGARYGGTLASNVYFRVYGKYFDDASEVFSDGSSAHDGWNQGQGGFRIDDVRSAQDHITVQGDLFTGDNDTLPGGEGTARATGTTFGGNILGRWTHTYSDDADMSLQMYYDRTHIAAPFQSSGAIPAGVLKDDLDTFDVDFQDHFAAGARNSIIWGLGYRFTADDVTPEPLVDFAPNKLDQNLFSGFWQDQFKIIDNVYLTAGSKLEHNDYTGFEYEPNVRLQWNITDKQMVWGAISRAVRMPSRYDENLLEPSPGFGVFLGTSNSDFMSETVLAYELGYRAQITPRISGSFSTFYNHYDDLRSLNYVDGAKPALPLVFANTDEGDTYGFELSADYQALEWWRLHAGYDLLKEHIFIKPGYTDLYNRFGDTADPEQQVFVRSSMDLPYHTTFDVDFRWIDQIYVNNGGAEAVVPSYAEADARIGWHATPHLEVAFVGQNLVHDQHAETGFPGPTQEQIVRSVYAEVSYHW